MDTWSWGPNTVTAVSTVVTAVVAIAGFIYAIVERGRAQQAERPDVSGRSMGGVGPQNENHHWTLKIATTVRNPSRRTIEVLSVAVEKPSGAGFVQGDDVRSDVRHDALVGPFSERPYQYQLQIPATWKTGTIVLRFDIASPVGGKIVQERCQIRLDT